MNDFGMRRFAGGAPFSGALRALAIFAAALTLAGCSGGWGLHRLVPEQSARVKFNFNLGWKLNVGDASGAEALKYDDSKWKDVSLPRAWNEDAAFKVDIHDLPTGVVWYRKRFVIPPSEAGKKFFIEFEGIRQAGEFWLNGEKLGISENGVMAFGFDLTRKLGNPLWENVLAVRIDNSWNYREQTSRTPFQWNDKNFNANYGGITKNVFLHATGRLYQTLPLYSSLGTTGVYIHADAIDVPGASATIVAESEVRNETEATQSFQYRVFIEDMDGRVVAAYSGDWLTLDAGNTGVVKASKNVSGLKLWSWGFGYLYTVTTALYQKGRPVDVVKTRTGFRKTEFGGGEVKLNGRVIQLKGYAQRSTNEWPAVGPCVPPWLSDFSNRMIVAGNGNLVRWMHVTPWKQDVESCDRVGLIQAMPAGDSEKDVEGRQWRQRVDLMRDAIVYNRNSPSIFFYECGNKGISEAHMAEMKALRDQFDPFGGRAIGCREMLGSKTAEYGGEMLYINKSAAKPLWAMEYSRDEGLRRWQDNFSPPYHVDGTGPGVGPEYNRNQDSHAIEDVTRWFDYWEQRPGTGSRASSGGVNIIFSDSNTHFRGSETYRRSGEVDAMRIPKEGFWAHEAMWDGWVDAERPHAHIVGHWNYSEGTTKDVHAVSNAARAELFLNGKTLGDGAQSKRFLFTFPKISYAPGTLRAVGYDAAGNQVSEDVVETAGAPAAIALTLMTRPGGMLADGADIALVQVEVVDAQGRRCPTAETKINFTLAGPAEWRGGIAQGPDNYILATSLPVECGVNRVLIRSKAEAGPILLRAGVAGLKPAFVKWSSLRVPVKGGLARILPGEGLPSYLDRGPTPDGPSYKVSRVAIPLATVDAGSGIPSVQSTHDDNEATGWSSDGNLANAWIEYHFMEPAPVNQVVMRLHDWRRKSYPLRITVDGREVWRGNTPKSLGYVTSTFAPTQGQSVRIALIGAAEQGEGFKNIVEVAGDPNAAPLPSVAPAAAQAAPSEPAKKGLLEIDEAEFYMLPPLTQ